MPQLFGAKLRYLRKRQRLTQTEVAHQLDLAGHRHISHIEHGRDAASLELLLKIAQLFGTTTDYLLRDTIPVAANEAGNAANAAIVEWSPARFGEKLRELRVQRGLTQVALAQSLGLAGQGHISNLEAGRKAPSLDLVVQIADVLGVSTDNLLKGR